MMKRPELASIELGFLRGGPKRSPPILTPLEVPAQICVLEVTSTGSVNESYCRLSELELPPPPSGSSPDVTARIYIAQGSENLHSIPGPWYSFDFELWDRFLKAHCSEKEDLQHELEREEDNVLFLNWNRLVAQWDFQYEIEKRILSGKPYDPNTLRDPMDLNISHYRYANWPTHPYREYGVISQSEDGIMLHQAARERVSFIFDKDTAGVFTGVLLFDPTRHQTIFRGEYNDSSRTFDWDEQLIPSFVDLPASVTDSATIGIRDQFKDLVHRCESILEFDQTQLSDSEPRLKKFISIFRKFCDSTDFTDNDPQSLVQMALARLACEDLAPLLERMGRMLDAIEISLHNDTILQNSLPTWRRQLGNCRKILFNESESLHNLHASIELKTAAANRNISSASSSTSAASAGGSSANGIEKTRLLGYLKTVALTVDRVQKRVDSDHQAIMSSMSILESGRAIAEATVVSKLTQLAFFFIPLSLVAAVFGMNINEFEGRLTWWHWLVGSVSSSAATYILLYWTEMTTKLQRYLNKISGLSLESIWKRIPQRPRIFLSATRRLPPETKKRLAVNVGTGILISGVLTFLLLMLLPPYGAVLIAIAVAWPPMAIRIHSILQSSMLIPQHDRPRPTL
ncbi:hypothetical protein TWF718_005074 [Orbilia javanica]|uniref:Uncharacterized protein n=1 Tax=Orbilia javanica TaxID=47235 RepID=A0AAN8MYQ8_9PEZI